MSQTKAQLISDLVQALNFTGTSSAPANGIFLSAANTLAFATNSAQRLTINSAGTATFEGAINIPGKIFHAGDTDTAFGFPAADTISVETGGSEALRVDSLQRLLIGNSSNVASRTNANSFSPQFQLSSDTEAALSISRYSSSVNPSRLALQKGRGTIASKAIVLDDDTLGEIIFSGWDGDTFTNGAKIEAQVDGTPGDDDMPGCLIFKTTADGSAVPTERLRIDSNGDIYTSGDQVRDNARLTLEKSASGIATLLNLHNSNGSGSGARISSSKALILAADFDSNTGSGESFIAFETDGTQKIRITEVGQMGIGTDSPSDLLHLKSTTADVDLIIEATGTNKDARIRFLGHSGGLCQLQFGDQNDGNIGLLTYDHTDNSMQFRTNDNEHMRLTSAGNLGVGITNPAGKIVANSDENTATFIAKGEVDNPSYPSYGFSGQNADNGSRGAGMYLPADGQIAFSTHGSERLRFDSSGDIYTSGDQVRDNARLTVTKNASGITTALCLHNGSGEGSKISSTRSLVLAADFDVNSGAGESFIAFETDGTEKMRLIDGGNVGIGTTSPSRKLHITGTSGQTIVELQRTNANATGAAGTISFTALDGHSIGSISCVGDGDDDGGEIMFRTTSAAANNDPYNAATPERMRLDSLGRLGIGTSSPERLLHVHGNALIENNIGNILTIRSTVNNGNDPNLHFEKGRGGAGTTAIVQNNDDLGEIQFKGYDGDSYDIGARIMAEVEGTPSNGNIPTRFVFQTRADGGSITTRMHIGANGRVGIATGTPSEQLHVAGNILASGSITPNSDIAFKKDIEPLTNVLNKITQLFGVNFRYKDNNEKSMGLLAQDVEKVFPELIRGKEGEKSLNYMGLTGAIVEAIKELSDKVAALEAS